MPPPSVEEFPDRVPPVTVILLLLWMPPPSSAWLLATVVLLRVRSSVPRKDRPPPEPVLSAPGTPSLPVEPLEWPLPPAPPAPPAPRWPPVAPRALLSEIVESSTLTRAVLKSKPPPRSEARRVGKECRR